MGDEWKLKSGYRFVFPSPLAGEGDRRSGEGEGEERVRGGVSRRAYHLLV